MKRLTFDIGESYKAYYGGPVISVEVVNVGIFKTEKCLVVKDDRGMLSIAYVRLEINKEYNLDVCLDCGRFYDSMEDLIKYSTEINSLSAWNNNGDRID